MSAGVAREPLAEAEASHAEISDSVASGGTNSSSAQAVKMSEKDFQRVRFKESCTFVACFIPSVL